MEASNNSISQHLEGFLGTLRKLEEELGVEKKKAQKIAEEYTATRGTLENGIRELQSRLVQRENRIQAITEAYRNLQANEARLKEDLKAVTERAKNAAAELAQYQTAWNEVLAREAQARGSLIEYEQAKRTLNQQRAQIQSIEESLKEANQANQVNARHADTYQRELQSALIRIQSSESKFNQLQKEYALVSQNKRSADEEIARIEASMKERFKWELATEKERLRAELEKDSALDRERFREVARNQMREEIERAVAAERQGREAAAVELEKVTRELNQLRSRYFVASEELKALTSERASVLEARANSEGNLIDRAERAEKTLISLRSEVAMKQMEQTQLQTKFEEAKKDSNKALLKERIRAETMVAELNSKIEALTQVGYFVAKATNVPADTHIYLASPVDELATTAGTASSGMGSLSEA